MTAWIVENMVLATAAMLLVLLVRKPVASLFGAGAAYALWLIPPLRLILPPIPALDAPIPSVVPPLDVSILIPASNVHAATVPWVPMLGAIWVAGMTAFIGWQWLGYRRFLMELSLASRSIGSHAGLPLMASPAVMGPLALGLLDRRIVVPADFEDRYSSGEQQLALAHEAIHHRRGDIWANLAALLVLAVNWFNPVAWLAFRAYREDQELACDAAVAAAAAPQVRADYARALIKAASRPGLIAACPLNHVDQLKRRLKMIKDHRSSRLRMLGGAAAVTLLAAGTASLGSAGFAHPHPEGEAKTHNERVIIMHRGDAKAGDAEHHVRIREGEGGMVIGPDCEPSQRTDINEGSDSERTRIVLCNRGDATPAQRAEHLQHARDRLAQDENLSEAQRARVTAALDREIARLRGQ